MSNRSDETVTIIELKKRVMEFVKQRGWASDHNPKNLAMCIAIEAAELMEIFQWISIEESWKINESKESTHLKEELADILIYCCSLANQLDIDIALAFEDKMQKNENRFLIRRENL